MPSARKRQNSNDLVVLVAYYVGSYGPTLRIDIQTLADILEIRKITKRLSSREVEKISLEKLGFVVLKPPVESLTLVTLRAGGEGAARRRGRIKRRIGADGSMAFEWAQTAEEWSRAVGLINGLYEAGKRGTPCHQYLNDDSNEEVLLEMALME